MNFIKKLPIALLLFCVTNTTQLISQDYDFTRVGMIVNGRTLENPGTGGLRAGQFSKIDFDNDGVKDLYIFDRNGGVVLPFLNKGTSNEVNYEYAPQYKKNFPKIKGWSFLKDFNGDGLEDLFMCPSTPGIAGIEVRRAKRVDGEIVFEQVTFDYGLNTVLMYPTGSAFPQIYVSILDFPAIEDVDLDGDIDILTFEPDGSYAQWYQNMVVEEGLGLDTFKFVLGDNCWGKFYEQELSEEVLLSENQSLCANGLHDGHGQSGNRHSGSTLLVFDGDGDGDKDLVLGDLSSDKIVYLTNGGSQSNAFVTEQDVAFPNYDLPVEMDIFLGAFYLDMDNDGARDLIVTPNDEGGGQNFDHIWYYKNIGTDSAPVFELQNRDVILNQTLHLGGGSDPEFLDYNQDGLMDLVVGISGYRATGGDRVVTLNLFENTGQKNQDNNPIYRLVDEDYLGFSQFTETSSRFSPAIGDLDGDGDMDLIVGDNQGRLYFCKNKAGEDNPFSFDPPIYNYANIFIGQNALPQIMDLDGDGLSDLIVGEKNDNQNSDGLKGGLNFFKNIGSVGNPQFDPSASTFPNNNVLGGVFTKDMGFISGSSSPYFYDDGDNKLAVVGSDSGILRLYGDIEENLYDTFTVVSDHLGEIFVGRRSNPALYDIDDDGYLEICVGNARGGLEFFNSDIPARGPSSVKNISEPEIKLYPNPTSGNIEIKTDQQIERIEIVDILGSVIMRSNFSGRQNFQLNVTHLHSGMYYCVLHFEGGIQTKKIYKH